MNTKLQMTMSSDRELHIERVFDAPRERLWQALTDPTQLAQWWGRGNKLEVERFEPQPGGHWRFVEHSDGERWGFEGRGATFENRVDVDQVLRPAGEELVDPHRLGPSDGYLRA